MPFLPYMMVGRANIASRLLSIAQYRICDVQEETESSMGIMERLMISCAAFIFLSGAFGFEALFAPDAEPWSKWEKHDPGSIARIDHSDWDLVLKSYIRPGPDGVNRFAYSRFSAEDATQLHRYIDRLAAISISQFSQREQLAYWINLYNALTTQVVATHYPVASIREIDLGGGGFGDGPW